MLRNPAKSDRAIYGECLVSHELSRDSRLGGLQLYCLRALRENHGCLHLTAVEIPDISRCHSVFYRLVSEEWENEDGKPIGIGGDPSGATAEKGNQIYDSFVESILSGLKEIRKWKD